MTLLDPEDRDLYTDLLRPPPGMRFDAGIGATYSLDLDTLLTVPLHLLLYSGEHSQDELLEGGIALLDGLRRISDRLRIYGQRGRIQAPRGRRALYVLLDELAVEVEPPAGEGSFHSKFWLLRFRKNDADRTFLRLLVLSRNVTRDPSWDVALQLEGAPTGEAREGNRPLAGLIRRLPDLATRAEDGPSAAGPDHDRLADELVRTRWELPRGFEGVRFHCTGLDGKGWLPAPSDRLAALSPFCSARALEALAQTTEAATDLVSRPEELVELPAGAETAFERVYILDDFAEQVEEEELLEEARGLHAKVYLAEKDGRTHLYLGSANATTAALLGGRNVEVMAELVGPTESVGGVQELMDPDGLRALLREWDRPEEVPERDPDRIRAERDLEGARQTLARAGLGVRCERRDDNWALMLEPTAPVELDGIQGVTTWPVTVDRDRAVDAGPVLEGDPVELNARALVSLTGLIAFRLEASAADEAISFVLNLPVAGLPREKRNAAVVRGIVRDQESFLRYLLLLLGELDEGELLGPGSGTSEIVAGWGSAIEELPLLEELTRAYCRDPSRLEDVRELLSDLEALAPGEDGGDPESVVPETFRELWATFEVALGEDTP
jgi:hypothetical protein